MVQRRLRPVAASGSGPVTELIWERLLLTVVLSLDLAAPHLGDRVPDRRSTRRCEQYSPGDYLFTFLGFVGLAIPDFLLGAGPHVGGVHVVRLTVGGPVLAGVHDAPWSWARSSTCSSTSGFRWWCSALGGTAGLIRVMRANLLDELHKPYVVTARAKGMPERRAAAEVPGAGRPQPVRQHVGWTLPGLVSGSIIVSVVLNLPTTGPLLLTRAAVPGHVPGRRHHPAAQHPDGHRDADLGHPAGLARSAHPVGIGSA